MIKKDLTVLKSFLSKFIDKKDSLSIYYRDNKIFCKGTFFEVVGELPSDIYQDLAHKFDELGKPKLLSNQMYEIVKLEELKNTLIEPNPEIISLNFLKCSTIVKQIDMKSEDVIDEGKFKSIISIIDMKLSEIKPMDMLYISSSSISSSNPKDENGVDGTVIKYELSDFFFNLPISKTLANLISKESLIQKLEILNSELDEELYIARITVVNAKRIKYIYTYKIRGNRDITILK